MGRSMQKEERLKAGRRRGRKGEGERRGGGGGGGGVIEGGRRGGGERGIEGRRKRGKRAENTEMEMAVH